jgi:hypothetical protein
MSKEMREQINKVKNFGQLLNESKKDKDLRMKQLSDKVRNEKKEVFKKTDDNWHGNYGDNKDEVKLMYHSIINFYDDENKWTWRTSVWGNDDTAMYRDFNNEKEAKELFDKLYSLNKINYSDCENLGMDWF